MQHPTATGILTHNLLQVPSINSNTCQVHTPRLLETPLKWAAISFRASQDISSRMKFNANQDISSRMKFNASRDTHWKMNTPSSTSQDTCWEMNTLSSTSQDIYWKMNTPSSTSQDTYLEMTVAHHTFHTIYNNSHRPATFTSVFFSNFISLPFSTMFPFTVHWFCIPSGTMENERVGLRGRSMSPSPTIRRIDEPCCYSPLVSLNIALLVYLHISLHNGVHFCLLLLPKIWLKI